MFRFRSRHTPNVLSSMRIAFVPLLLAVFYYYDSSAWRDAAVAVLFIFAMLTDFLDGYVARLYQWTSTVGQLLDPVADKCLVCACLLLLLAEGRAPLAVVCIIVLRELYISALRAWMAARGQPQLVEVSAWGKAKTAVQMTAITMLLYNADLLNIPLADIGLLAIWAAAGLSAWSAFLYTLEVVRARPPHNTEA